MQDLALLRKLGLTEYEARVLLALVERGPSKVREVVDQSKVPKNKAYEVLERLVAKGLASALPLSPRQYRAEDVGKLADLARSRREELKEVERAVERFRERAARRTQEYKAFFSVVKGQKATQERLRASNEQAQHEVLTVNKLTQHLPMNLRAMRRGIERGVKVRMLCLVEEDNWRNVLRWKQVGAEIRVYNARLSGEPMPRFSVFDRKVVRITIGKPEIEDPDNYLSLWTESEALAHLFRAQFLAMWERSLPIEKEIARLTSAKAGPRRG